MKVKCISRSQEQFSRSTTRALHHTLHNPDPNLHPLERAREYKRALNAAKLDRVFAKPFVCALSRHEDAVSVLALCPDSLVRVVSGGFDGQVLVWDIARRSVVESVAKAHEGAVNGLAFAHDSPAFLTCGHDKTVKLFGVNDPTGMGSWGKRKAARKGGAAQPNAKRLRHDDDDNNNEGDEEDEDDDDEEEEEEEEEQDAGVLANPGFLKSIKPRKTFLGKNAFTGLDCHWGEGKFATTGAQVDVWDVHHTAPVTSFSWGAETTRGVKFNPVERSLLVTAGSDNTVVVYDVRAASPAQKLVMKMRTNAVAWNPMEAVNMTLANEDANLYTFDMRKLKFASCVHRDHLSAVMDVSYSPTGLEFVSAGYDRTVRIFPKQESRSREVYHTKRMGRVLCARFTGDAKYVLSGSDDHGIRLWKANASVPIRLVRGAEQRKLDYAEQLKQRYQHVPEVGRILRHRHLPKPLYKQKQKEQAARESEQRKEENRRKHSKPGSVKRVSERAKAVKQVVK